MTVRAAVLAVKRNCKCSSNALRCGRKSGEYIAEDPRPGGGEADGEWEVGSLVGGVPDIQELGPPAPVADYCFSYTSVTFMGLPSASVPLAFMVMVLPSFETTSRPVAWYLLVLFFVSYVKVPELTCLREMES